ncbi:hypothetical protein KPH14_011506 [Odynerus spinipes]|uniref:Uncharacterized protein n=1 Tax=Odynerus spinipes TaxID=1348599 RepID=A0AAD9RJ73_9HYME|nr:hypothetical protein KPH14_011506 [Odynerus spinipes]
MPTKVSVTRDGRVAAPVHGVLEEEPVEDPYGGSFGFNVILDSAPCYAPCINTQDPSHYVYLIKITNTPSIAKPTFLCSHRKAGIHQNCHGRRVSDVCASP